jgi:hypothetical protein
MSDKEQPYPVDDPLFPEKPGPMFRVYRMVRGEPHERIASYDTVEEFLKHRQRLDRSESVQKGRGEYIPVKILQEQLKATKD